jgi:hypothetical protein
MERDRYGYAFKYFVSKEFKRSMAYINNYCADVVRARRLESREQLAGRTDLLSKLLLSTKVGGSPWVVGLVGGSACRQPVDPT